MRPDHFAMHHHYRAKASGVSKADYACAVERSRARSDSAVRWALAAGFIAAICAAIWS